MRRKPSKYPIKSSASKLNEKTQGRWPPKRCDMPDLSQLSEKIVLNMMLNRAFLGRGPRDLKASALVANFVRLVEKTLIEYKNIHASLLEYVNTPKTHISPYIHAVNHMETCLISLNRCKNYIQRIKGIKAIHQIPRDIKVLVKNNEKRIRNIRRAIEHLDADISQDLIPVDEMIAVVVKSDSVELYGIEIFFTELAEWIKELHSLASILSDYK
jgi:hypothetical protein